MAGISLEERMTALEAEVAELRRKIGGGAQPTDAPWWQQRAGAFRDDPLYDEAARLGVEYRRGQATPADDTVRRAEERTRRQR